jgi:hypothetical protein
MRRNGSGRVRCGSKALEREVNSPEIPHKLYPASNAFQPEALIDSASGIRPRDDNSRIQIPHVGVLGHSWTPEAAPIWGACYERDVVRDHREIGKSAIAWPSSW